MHSRFIALTALLLSLVTGFGISVAQENIVSIAIPTPAISYVVSPDGATAALYPNPVLVREEPPNADATVVRIVDLATGNILQTLDNLPDWVSDAVYLPDGRLLTAHTNGDFMLWDVGTGAIERQWWTGLYQSRLRVSPDGTRAYVLSSGAVSTFFEMDVASGALLRAIGRRPATLSDLLGSQTDIEFRGDYTFVDFALSPDGETLAYANADGEILVSDLDSEAFTLVRPPSEQPLAFDARHLRFAPDGASLFYLQANRDARQVMHVEPDGTLIASFGEGVAAYAVSPDGLRVAWVERSDDGARILVQDVAGGEANLVYDLREADLDVPPIATLSFAVDGTRLLLDANPTDGDDEQAILLIIPVG
jgi:WD40 repeat protein